MDLTQWKDFGVIFISLLTLAWTAFVYFSTNKSAKSQKTITEFSELQKVHITEATGLRHELRDMLYVANQTISELKKGIDEAKEATNTAKFEKAIVEGRNHDLEKTVERLTKQIANLEKQFDESLEREELLEQHLEEIRSSQLERVEHERETAIENERLKTEVEDLRKNIQSSIRFYETQLGEKETQLKTLTETSKRQGKAIETMKEILEKNNLTADVEL